MKRLSMVGIMVGLCLMLVRPGVALADPASEKAALAAAQAWLAQVDAGNYAGSYKESASLFRSAITEAKWVGLLGQVRKPLGKVTSRTVKITQYTTSVPGAPAGKYVVIEFSTSFAKKAGAVERVTPMLDKDGKWRVSGYFIR